MIRSKQYPKLVFSDNTLRTLRVLDSQQRIRYIRELFSGTVYAKTNVIENIQKELVDLLGR